MFRSKTCCVGKTAAIALLLALACSAASAGPLRDLLQKRFAERRQDTQIGDEDGASRIALPPGVSVVRDVRYGDDTHQRFDVYLPPHPAHAPVIFMVHGGGWRRGDKTMQSVVQNKLARWVPKGAILISVDYRLLPEADPLQQADDVAAALATAQKLAPGWGGDPARFVLIGHSAGAHLVSLLASEPALATKHGARPWLGTVSLDSAALDVPKTMQGRHLRLHDDAFGHDPAYWTSVSPYQQLTKAGAPFLAVCSTRRSDSCPQASSYAARAHALGMRASVLREDLSHRDINQQLGTDGSYTRAVETFLGSLDPSLRRLLKQG